MGCSTERSIAYYPCAKGAANFLLINLRFYPQSHFKYTHALKPHPHREYVHGVQSPVLVVLNRIV